MSVFKHGVTPSSKRAELRLSGGGQTLHDRYVAALQKGGAVIEPSKTKKYTVLRRIDGRNYYVGRSGAVRLGTTVAGSVPISDNFKKKLLESLT